MTSFISLDSFIIISQLAFLVIYCSLNDIYFILVPTEPAKHAAELRHKASPESGPTCLKIDMTAGHFSASDRYKYLKELSFDYAFLLDQLGLAGCK